MRRNTPHNAVKVKAACGDMNRHPNPHTERNEAADSWVAQEDCRCIRVIERARTKLLIRIPKYRVHDSPLKDRSRRSRAYIQGTGDVRLVVCIDKDRTSCWEVLRGRLDRVKNRDDGLRPVRGYHSLISRLYSQRVRATSKLGSGYEEVGTLTVIPTRKLSLKIAVT